MNPAVDACADTNHQVLHRISRLVALPDYVKDAGITDPEQVAKLPNTVFADPVNRKFPLHTKAAAWLAQTYFTESRHLYPTADAAIVQGKITKAAHFWHIEGHVKEARETLETKQTSMPPDLADTEFALVVKHEDQTHRLFPVHNAQNVEKAASELYRDRSKYPYTWRKTAARKILHKIAELAVTGLPEGVHEYLTMAASIGSAIPSQAAEKLAQRVLMLPANAVELRAKAARLAKTVAKMNGIPPAGEMEKLAQIVDRLDREHGFYRYYNAGVETPEEIFFTLTQKKAAVVRNSYIQLTTGTVIPFEALQSIPLGKVAAALGDDFSRAVMADNSLDVDLQKFGRIAATLPRGDATLLERALKAAGVLSERPALADVVL